MKKSQTGYGVSPAFIISKNGENFTLDDYASCMKLISSLGFNAFQLEIFHREKLSEWKNGGVGRLSACTRELDLVPTQFVAHFMMPFFSEYELLLSDKGLEEMKQVIELAAYFESCHVITLPIGVFCANWKILNPPGPDFYTKVKNRFIDKLILILDSISRAGFYLALEVLPFSILSGSEGFLNLYRTINSNRLGINLDTGHAWACKESVDLLPWKLKGKIFGTHLCDNSGHENLSLRPGTGSIDWKTLLKNLKLSGYKGSLDLEIHTCPTIVEDEYSSGLHYIKTLQT